MSSKLPAKIERVWEVDCGGVAVERTPPSKALTSGQRHYQYRLGLSAVDQFLKQRGFQSLTDGCQSTLSYQKRGVLLDIRITRPERIAYVTSYPGYEYASQPANRTDDEPQVRSVKARVILASEAMESDFVIQVTASTNDNQGTRAPIFIPLPKTLKKPAYYTVQNVLSTIALLCASISKLQEVFTVKDAEEAPRSLLQEITENSEEQNLPLLPD